MIEIETIQTPSLGHRTYLATDGASALVIDPQRDIGRVAWLGVPDLDRDAYERPVLSP